MTTLPTNLPVPSESPRDLKFNAGKIDEFVTSLANTYVDRFGNEHYTIEGLRWLAQQAIANYGWILIDSFQDGADITLPNQALRDEDTGEYYRWDGTLPKHVDAGSTPATTGGVGVGAWIGIGDASLRAMLATEAGAGMVGAMDENGNPTTVQDEINNFNSRIYSIEERDTGDIADSNSLSTPGMFTAMRAAENIQNFIAGTSIAKDPTIAYDAFTLTFKNRRGKIVTFFRRAPTHVNSRGVIMKTIMGGNGQWTTPVEVPVFSDPVMDCRGVTGGMMPNGNIVLCTLHSNSTTGIFGDVQFYTSKDDGETWTLTQTINVSQSSGYAYTLPYGQAVMMGKYIVIARYKTKAGVNSMGYFRSADGGVTWEEFDVTTDPTGTNDFNESAIMNIGRLGFIVARVGSGISGKFRLFRSLDGGDTWTDVGDSNFTGGDSAYSVTPVMFVLRNESGTPYAFLLYVNRTDQNVYYRTALVSDLLNGIYTFSEKQRITGGMTNSSGAPSGLFEGRRFIGTFYQETSPQTAAFCYSLEFSIQNPADYDSGWFAVAAFSTYNQPLGLAQKPTRAKLFFSVDSVGANLLEVDAYSNTSGASTYGVGALLQLSQNAAVVRTGGRVYGSSLFGTGGTEYTTGYYRLMVWL